MMREKERENYYINMVQFDFVNPCEVYCFVFFEKLEGWREEGWWRRRN